MPLPVGPPRDDRFACTLCGKCCDTLKERAGAPEWPSSFDHLGRLGIYGLRTERGLQVWAWERERMAKGAEARGLTAAFVPSLALLDDGVPGGRVVCLVYELDHARCPLLVDGPFPDTLVCGGYDARPIVCRSFPVVVRGGEAAYSLKCPSAFSPASPGVEGFRLTYGDSFDAADVGARVSREAQRLVAFMDTAGALKLRRGASREEVARRLDRGPVVDFWDVLGDAGVVDRAEWLARLERPAAVTSP